MDYHRLIELRKIISERMINELNNLDDFKLNNYSLTGIHERLFKGIYFNNGGFRKFNISREEPLLHNLSVDYADYHTIPINMQFIYNDELKKDYHKMNQEEVVTNIASLAAKIWRVHPFNDGNTRTTCIFVEKYLSSLGFTYNNEVFKDNAEYYRNALVKANYKNYEYGITGDLTPLINIYKKAIFNNDLELDDNDLLLPDLYIRLMQNMKKRKLKRS